MIPAILFLLFSLPLSFPDDSKTLTFEVQNCMQADKSTVPGISIYLGSASNIENRILFGVTDVKGQKSKKVSPNGIESLRDLADEKGRIQVSVEGLGLETQAIQSVSVDDIGKGAIVICAQDKHVMQVAELLTEFPQTSGFSPYTQTTYTSGVPQPIYTAAYTAMSNEPVSFNQPCCCCCCCCPVIPIYELQYGW